VEALRKVRRREGIALEAFLKVKKKKFKERRRN